LNASSPTCTLGDGALVFTPGYVSSVSGIATIARLILNCLVLSDPLNHNSMMKACVARGSDENCFHHGRNRGDERRGYRGDPGHSRWNVKIRLHRAIRPVREQLDKQIGTVLVEASLFRQTL